MRPLALSWRNNIYGLDECNISVVEALNKHSLFPLVLPTATIETSYHLQCIIDGDLAYMHSLHKWDYAACDLKVCFKCMNDQCYEHGYSWIKREWLIHGMDHCGVHNVSLSEYTCRNCYRGLDVKKLEDETPVTKCRNCGHDHVNESNSDISLYETFIIKVLERCYPYFSGPLKSNLLKEASRRMVPLDMYDTIIQEMKKKWFYHTDHEYSIYRYFDGEHDYIPYEVFWRIISSAFESFDDFDQFVTDNSVYREIEYSSVNTDKLPSKKIGIFDCI